MSDDLDGLLSTFGKLSDDEKQQNFEESTAKLIAKQLGCDLNDMPVADQCGWLEDQGLFEGRLFCQRVFNFKFEELIFKPTQHPIVRQFKEFGITDEPVTWVFKVFGYGRMVCTTVPPAPSDSYASVPNPLDITQPLYIMPFTAYFVRYNPE